MPMKQPSELHSDADMPKTSVRLSAQQLLPLTKALKTSIRATTEAFYNYLHSINELPDHMVELFNEYMPQFPDPPPPWFELNARFGYLKRSEFNELLEKACTMMEKDPEFEIYENSRLGYSITFPAPMPPDKYTTEAESFYYDMLRLFSESRLMQVTDNFALSSNLGEATLNYYVPHGNAFDHLSFESANSLCHFVNQLNPVGVKFSPKMLQVTRQ